MEGCGDAGGEHRTRKWTCVPKPWDIDIENYGLKLDSICEILQAFFVRFSYAMFLVGLVFKTF